MRCLVKLILPVMATASMAVLAATSGLAAPRINLTVTNLASEDVELLGVAGKPLIPPKELRNDAAPWDHRLRIRSIKTPEKYCDFTLSDRYTRVDVEPPKVPGGWMRHDVL